MKLFQDMKTKQTFRRILSLLLAMSSLMFLIAFLSIHAFVAKSYERQAKDSARQMLVTAGEYVDMALLDLGRAMQQQLWDTDITGAILLPDEVFYGRKAEIVKALSTFEQDHPLAKDANLLTYGSQMLYSSAGEISPIKDMPQRSFLPQFNSDVAARTISDGSFSTTVLTVGGRIALLQDFPTPETNGALLVEVERSYLFRFLEQSLSETGDPYVEVHAPSGTLICSIGGQENTYRQSESYTCQAGWEFCLWQDTAQAGTRTLQLVGIWALLFCAVGVAVSIVITWKIYQPIHTLRAAVGGQETGAGENELDIVRHAYETTVQQKTSLSLQVAEMAPIVRDRLYKNLLKGETVSDDYLLDRLAYLNSPFPLNGMFSVMVGALRESYGGSPDELMGRLYQYLRRASEEQTGEEYEFYHWECVLMDDYSIVILVSPALHALPTQLKSTELFLIRRIQAFLRQNNAADAVVLGRGKLCHGLVNLHYSYREALEEVGYRQYHGDGMEEPAHFFEGDCRQMIEQATNGSVGDAARSLELLIQYIRGQQHTPAQVRKEYDRIIDCLVDALLGLRVPKEVLDVFEPYYQQADTADEETLEKLLLSVGGQALDILGRYGQKSRNRYVAQAKKYIQERCVDSHLSLDRVAESVGITPAYLSRLFYELSDVNFVNYVNSCRVERAKLLLCQSKIPIQEIGFRCGFNSLQNFSRAFKRQTGITPGAYRKQAAGPSSVCRADPADADGSGVEDLI